MSSRRKIAELAHQLFELSLENGLVSPERVTGVLAWVEKHRPASASAVLRAYRRLVEADLGRRRAVIEYAGEVSPATFAAIASAMSQRFGRAIEAVPQPRPELIAGLRVRVGDNVFENNVVNQLAALQPPTCELSAPEPTFTATHEHGIGANRTTDRPPAGRHHAEERRQHPHRRRRRRALRRPLRRDV